jgi:acyl carrier protein
MLSGLAEQYLVGAGTSDRVTLPSLPHSSDRHPDRAFLLQSLGHLWLAGIDPDWMAVHANERRSRVNLPTYPFERKAYWRSPTRRRVVPRDEGPRESATAAVPAAKEIPVTVSAQPEDTHSSSRAHAGADYVAPRNSTEQRIVEIWEDLLGIHPIGVHDEFLRLGGNSLLAIRVAADLREAFQIEFPLQALLSASTIADIAMFTEDALLTMIEGMNENEVSEMENK